MRTSLVSRNGSLGRSTRSTVIGGANPTRRHFPDRPDPMSPVRGRPEPDRHPPPDRRRPGGHGRSGSACVTSVGRWRAGTRHGSGRVWRWAGRPGGVEQEGIRDIPKYRGKVHKMKRTNRDIPITDERNGQTGTLRERIGRGRTQPSLID
jgi:hypothetical protein